MQFSVLKEELVCAPTGRGLLLPWMFLFESHPMAMSHSSSWRAGSKAVWNKLSAILGTFWFRKWQIWCRLNLLEFCVMLVFVCMMLSGLKTGKNTCCMLIPWFE